jgi:hypothetical protein
MSQSITIVKIAITIANDIDTSLKKYPEKKLMALSS